jgi:hypothetical protein
MPGKEALNHICKTDRCSVPSAIEQLRCALSDGAVTGRLTDANLPRGAIYSSMMLMSMFDCIPAPERWQDAKIRPDGTVQFFDHPYYEFAIFEEDVLRVWPAQPQPSVPINRKKARPVEDGAREALSVLWPNGIPAGLKAKDRNNKIRNWLRQQGYSSSTDEGLARAVQRALKPRA